MFPAYNEYKKITQYPSGYTGKDQDYVLTFCLIVLMFIRLQMEKQLEICKDLL